MNTIEKEIYDLIQSKKKNLVKLKFELDITFDCASIVEKHAVNYKKYVLQYFIQVKRIEPLLYVKRNDRFTSNVEEYDSSIYNEQDVFKMYIKSLEKQQ